ncbi:transglycosylase SLT domain-containing protein [Succinimonas sp.]|uniref:transglycosylase SLT domain-containing protein n=1 Tax=Succinimonas sp. TaxID=1936151 RepID=UPI00386504ED
MYKVSSLIKHLTGCFCAVVPSVLALCVTACASTQEPLTTEIKTETVVRSSEVSAAYKHDFKRYQGERQKYLRALAAYEKKDFDTVRRIHSELGDYPLNVYLDYLLLKKDRGNTARIKKFITSGGHTGLARYVLNDYMHAYANNGNYDAVLEISPEMPEGTKLQCLWHQARYYHGKKQEALSFIKADYEAGEPLSKECSSLLGTLKAGGLLTRDMALERIRSTYWTKNGGKVYLDAVSQLGRNEADKTLAKTLSSYYGKPSKYAAIPVTQKEAASLVFARFARTSPEAALAEIGNFKNRYHPTAAQEHTVNQALVYALLYNKTSASRKLVDDLLESAGNAAMLEQRIRVAIWDRDYRFVLRFIDRLPEDKKQADNYRYWKARALEETGKKAEADAIFRKLAKERSFYGFYTADKLGLPYAIKPVTAVPANEKQKAALLKKYPAYARYMEFSFLNDARGIRTEWRETMHNASLDDARTIAATEAERGFTDLAVWESIYKKDWDALNVRFPLPYRKIYEQESRRSGTDLSYMYAITRQESMMNPLAKSPVGARGLMQFMPDTAAMVSKKYGYPYGGKDELFNPSVNIRLGGAYLHDLQEKFGGNRIFATAGYNAGPGRAYKWQSGDGVRRDAITYIESIPFNETRNYVQKVLMYNVIYQHLLGAQKLELLTPSEHDAHY